MIDPITAGVYSLFVPGFGQLFTGKPGRAVYFGLLAVFVWTISFGLFGWTIHLCAAFDAWYRALPEATEPLQTQHLTVARSVTPEARNPRSEALPDNVIILSRRGFK